MLSKGSIITVQGLRGIGGVVVVVVVVVIVVAVVVVVLVVVLVVVVAIVVVELVVVEFAVAKFVIVESLGSIVALLDASFEWETDKCDSKFWDP